MIYEFIATFSAAFLMAGIALILRHLVKLLFKKQLPKWIIPLFAATGIFYFQIYQEYNWFDQTKSKFKEGIVVIKIVENTSWYRPWSYFKNQPVRAMTVDTREIEVNQLHPDLKWVNIYLHERLMSIKIVPQVFDCKNAKYTDASLALSPTDSDKSNWYEIDPNDKLFQVVCNSK